MEEEIKRFKEQVNGGTVTYTTKELIGGLHVKLDDINKKLENGAKKFAAIETTLVWHNRLITTLFTMIGAFLVKPVRSIIDKIGGLL
ncbi:hypothetical protein LCGC14_2848170 [marine sediment metagenome]|uniref:Uncharacterized protein n=1 Tax=marine sediment metagenome TaxID=412755 RepID=A0A0F9AHL2_9ZZZZ